MASPLEKNQVMTSSSDELTASINTLQLGMEWFPETTGGLNRVFYDCINHLPGAGVHVQGLVVGRASVQEESGGLVSSVAPLEDALPKRWQALRKMVRQRLTEDDYSLVASHFALYTFPVLDLLGDRPLVTHFHGPWALETGVETGARKWQFQLRKWLEKSSYQRAQRLIVLSDAFRQLLHREFEIPLDRIDIVPPGIETEKFDANLSQFSAREQLGWSQDRPIILSVRRLAKRMGLENLIAAIAQVRLVHPDVLLLIAGKGGEAQALQMQIEDLGLVDHVRLLGFVSDQDLKLAYRAADFSVVPTVAYEGFGLIVAECLSAGTPVMGTPVDAIPETLSPLSEQMLFEGSEVEDLVRGISEVLSGQRQLPDAETCKQYVRENYDWSVVSQQMKRVYQRAMDEYGHG